MRKTKTYFFEIMQPNTPVCELYKTPVKLASKLDVAKHKQNMLNPNPLEPIPIIEFFLCPLCSHEKHPSKEELYEAKKAQEYNRYFFWV